VTSVSSTVIGQLMRLRALHVETHLDLAHCIQVPIGMIPHCLDRLQLSQHS